AVAGIMGGEYSGIMEDTTTVVFEAACFKGTSVRTTAKKLGLRTESSARFEKGLDAQNCVPAIMRACELVELLGAGEVVDGMIDVDASDKTPFTLKLEHEWINRFLGINIPKEEMVKILEKVGFTVNGDDVTVPFFRIDIEHKADIAEEIARFYGYNNIPTTVLKGTAEAQLTAVQKFERKMSDIVLSMGGYEVITYSFISPKYYDKILLPKDSAQRESVVISNPLGEDTSVMRTTTLPSMLEILSRNYNNRNPKAFMYEIGNEYISQAEGELPQENPQLTIGLYGENTDFYALKGIVEVLIERLNLGEIDVAVCSENPTFHPGRCAVISKGGIHIGILGEVHPKVCNNYEIGTKTYIAKLDMNAMFSLQEEEKQYKPLPKFPATSRDLSVLCDKDLPIVQIEKAIKESVGKILEKVELFDVYQGAQVPEGQKSVAYSIIMRSHEGTLTDEQTDAAMKRVLKAFDKMGIKLRS
ncbi:MAG: pheT, partial [Oscillospiraceae bacterium]|nr:pheT [Oscillospiraceae bacterium]